MQQSIVSPFQLPNQANAPAAQETPPNPAALAEQPMPASQPQSLAEAVTPEQQSAKDIGKVAEQLAGQVFEQRPDLHERYKMSNVDDYLADPQLLESKIRTRVRPLFDFMPDRIENAMINRLDPKTQGLVRDVRSWALNEPAQPSPTGSKLRSSKRPSLEDELSAEGASGATEALGGKPSKSSKKPNGHQHPEESLSETSLGDPFAPDSTDPMADLEPASRKKSKTKARKPEKKASWLFRPLKRLNQERKAKREAKAEKKSMASEQAALEALLGGGAI